MRGLNIARRAKARAREEGRSSLPLQWVAEREPRGRGGHQLWYISAPPPPPPRSSSSSLLWSYSRDPRMKDQDLRTARRGQKRAGNVQKRSAILLDLTRRISTHLFSHLTAVRKLQLQQRFSFALLLPTLQHLHKKANSASTVFFHVKQCRRLRSLS